MAGVNQGQLKSQFSAENVLLMSLIQQGTRCGWESQALGINIGSKTSFNYWIDIEIQIKYEIKNELHRDW
jgi:hypothetical protein